MARVLEAPRVLSQPVVYDLADPCLPLALLFARRRSLEECVVSPERGTSSDGATSGNDGSGGGNDEEFDWIDDD